MKDIHLVVVGKNKDDSLSTWENNFTKRLKTIGLKIHELKYLESKSKNDAQVIHKIHQLSENSTKKIILLDEKGKSLTSRKFSEFIFKNLEDYKNLFFVVGGADGHGDEIKQIAHEKIKLSDLTLPHRLARVIFTEQLYRAESIYLNHPYHK